MSISGSTRVFMILGDPVAQARAPELFNHLFREHGVDAVVVPAHVAPRHLEGFVSNVLNAGNIDGLLLTIPHKGAVIPMLDKCDRLGRVAGAVNAVRRNADGSLEGALFDGIGFVKSLRSFGVTVKGLRAKIVGVGGAGVAIATSLADQGAARISLYDPNGFRTAKIAMRLHAEFHVDAVAADNADPAGHDLLVNATPLGLQPGDALPFDVSRIDENATVVDILMKNQPTPLLQACLARGLRAEPGYQMLVQQLPDYLTFFGLENIARAVQSDFSAVSSMISANH